ncbi:MAG: diguanylate cyclase [Comamonadaceae bacterium]|nr:diguanylate cyclase [Comamonadaceae bacterium]
MKLFGQNSQSTGHPSSVALLRFVIAALIIGPIATLLALGSSIPSMAVNYFGPLMMLTVALTGWFFLARGQIDRATSALVYGVCFATTVIATFTGGVRSPVVVVYPVIILIFGWLRDERAAATMAGLTILLAVSLWIAEVMMMLPAFSNPPSLVYAVHQVIIYALSAVLAHFVLRTYKQRLKDLKDTSLELAKHSQLLELNTNLLQRAQAVAKVGSWVSDINTDTITPSLQCCYILGIAEGSSTSFGDYLARVHANDRSAVDRDWRKALKPGQGRFDGEHRIIVNGAVRWIRQKAEVEFDTQGQPVSALGIAQDITDHKLTQLALKASEQRHRTLIEWTPEAILVHRQTRILYGNPSAVRLFGAPDLASLQAKTTTELIHPGSLDSQCDRMQCIQRKEPVPALVEARFLKFDGTVIDVEVQGTAIDYDGEPAIHVSIRDITERKQLENEIRQLAFYDALTHLPNRRLLSDRLAQTLSASKRSGCYSALMFLDLDNFKPLNDSRGHTVGDVLLVEAAQRIKGCVREMDTVARFGGDEFVVLLAELDSDWSRSAQHTQNVANKIRLAMSAPYSLEFHSDHGQVIRIQHRCTASIGVVVYASTHANPDDLTKWADAAMYQAKSEGRNRISFSANPPHQQGGELF